MNPCRVLVAVEGSQSAVAHVRGLQYQDLFDQHADFDVQYLARTSPFPPGAALNGRQRMMARLAVGPVYRRLVRRQERRILQTASDCDVVYTLSLPSPQLHRELCRLSRPRIVMEVIDAFWLPYHKQFGWDGLFDMVTAADGIICENEYVAKRIREHHGHVHIVPDSPQLDRFDELREEDIDLPPADEVRIGWVGSPDSSVALFRVWEVLEELFSRYPHLHLRLVGADPERLPPFENVRWSVVSRYDQEQMIKELLAMDIGLFPLFHVEDSLTRGTLKARLYMCGEVAVVSEDYGGSQTLIEDGVNGFLAGAPEEWVEKLSSLIEQADVRAEMARQGLQSMREHFSKPACFLRLTDALSAFGP